VGTAGSSARLWRCLTLPFPETPQALEDAARAAARDPAPDREERTRDLSARAAGVRRFLDARAALATDPAAAVAACQQLLLEGGGGGGAEGGGGARVKPGDVLGMLAEWCVDQGNGGQALQVVRQMEGRGLAPGEYLPAATLAAVYAANGLEAPAPAPAAPPSGGGWEEGDGGVAAGAVAAPATAGRRRGGGVGSGGGAGGGASGGSTVEEAAVAAEELPHLGDA
jgi:hypothetical protein